MATCDANTGNYVLFDEKTDKAYLPTAAVASSSVPFIFPSKKYKNMTLVDGGIIWNLNIDSAVEKCRQIVDDDSQIVIDVIITD